MPDPGPERIFSHVYADEPVPMAAQREAALAYYASLESR